MLLFEPVCPPLTHSLADSVRLMFIFVIKCKAFILVSDPGTLIYPKYCFLLLAHSYRLVLMTFFIFFWLIIIILSYCYYSVLLFLLCLINNILPVYLFVWLTICLVVYLYAILLQFVSIHSLQFVFVPFSVFNNRCCQLTCGKSIGNLS